MNILITGGAGFIGSHVADYALQKDHKVIIFDNLSTGNLHNVNPAAEFVEGDITSTMLEEVFKQYQIDIVIHNAAQIDIQKSLKEPVFDARVNILGTVNVLECMKKYKVKKIIYPSTAAAYGDPQYLPVDEEHIVNPLSYYGISKHTPEHYIKTYCMLNGMKYTIFRYANVYGIRQDPKGEGGVVSIFIDKLKKGEKAIIFGDGEQTRDFIYVKDIASANMAALQKGDNQIINISSNNSVTINELHAKMAEIYGTDTEPRHMEPRAGDIIHSRLDNTKAKNSLDWRPEYSLTDGLAETINYYR